MNPWGQWIVAHTYNFQKLWANTVKRLSLWLCMLVAQSCPTLCNLMDCSMPGFPVHHQLPGLAQTHVHLVSDAIKPSQPLSSLLPPSIFPSIRVFLMSQFFASAGQSIGVSASASVLLMHSQVSFRKPDFL